MTYFLMYLLTIVDRIPPAIAPVSVLSGVGLLIVSIIMAMGAVTDDESIIKGLTPWYKRLIFSFIISLSLCIFIPSSKAIAFIYIAPQLIENGAVKDTVKNIPELTKLGTEYLKELLKDKVEDIK